MQEKKDTIISISQRTGYSISTVSRVLNGKAEAARISKKAVEIIRAEAERCNYTPSLLAKGLRTNKTHTIGLVVPSLENSYFSNLSSAIIREARTYGYTIVVIDTMEDERNERVGVESLVSRNVDGLVVIPCGQDPAWLEEVNRNQKPVMLIDRYFLSTELSYVCMDNYRGGFEATRYLLDQGHRNILCIQGTPHSMPVKERVRGYCEALAQVESSAEPRVVGDSFSIQNGYLETRLALSSPNRPTAIFAVSNTILLGVIKAVRAAGLRIPEDISVITFDSNSFLDYINPPITRVGQPVSEIGSLSIRLLIQALSEKRPIDTKLLLNPQLIVCESVRRLE